MSSSTEFHALGLLSHQVVKGMLGADVCWTGYVISVHEYNSGHVGVMIEPTLGQSGDAAAFTFREEWKTKLFSLKKHDIVKIEAIYRGSSAPYSLDGKSLEVVHKVALPSKSSNQ